MDIKGMLVVKILSLLVSEGPVEKQGLNWWKG